LANDFHLGVALPDLLSAYDRQLRFHQSRVQKQLAVSQNIPLWLGVKNHLITDAFFHKSEFFKKSYQEIRPILIRTLPPELNVRPFFLGHIAVELLLDHWLLKNNPSLAGQFYATLQPIDLGRTRTELESFFAIKIDRFDYFMNKFMTLRFVESYSDLKNLIGAMNRMLMRTRQEPITDHNQVLFHNALQASLETVEFHFPSLIHEFKSLF
jgi:hypothetical protein